MPYEYHNYKDPRLKIIFHTDHLIGNQESWLHWHKSPEFLLVLQGKISVNCNGTEWIYDTGELAVINSNDMHQIRAYDSDALYHCLIVDPSVCDIGRLPVRSGSPGVITLYHTIVGELQEQKSNYREAVTGFIKAMLSILSREISDASSPRTPSRKLEATRGIIEYMYHNFQRELSLEEISDAVNLNKYYLSHIFKETTGRSVLSHLNYIRCSNALSMLSSGEYNVTQSAYASGFTNLSYFSKTYKKIIGNSPGEDIPRQHSDL